MGVSRGGCGNGEGCGGVHMHELSCRKQDPHAANAALRGRDPQHEILLQTLVCPVGVLYEARHHLQKAPTSSGFPEETMAGGLACVMSPAFCLRLVNGLL